MPELPEIPMSIVLILLVAVPAIVALSQWGLEEKREPYGQSDPWESLPARAEEPYDWRCRHWARTDFAKPETWPATACRDLRQGGRT